MSEFQDDLIVKESETVVLLEHVWLEYVTCERCQRKVTKEEN